MNLNYLFATSAAVDVTNISLLKGRPPLEVRLSPKLELSVYDALTEYHKLIEAANQLDQAAEALRLRIESTLEDA
jgi:hypothetical protein